MRGMFLCLPFKQTTCSVYKAFKIRGEEKNKDLMKPQMTALLSFLGRSPKLVLSVAKELYEILHFVQNDPAGQIPRFARNDISAFICILLMYFFLCYTFN